MEQFHIILERWRGAYEAQEMFSLNARQAQELILTLANESSATLSIAVEDHELIIGASMGLYTATALLGADNFLDLVADPSEQGTTSFIMGGQMVDVPRRHCISGEQALIALLEFLENGTVDLTRGKWEKQD
ncbi:MAG TPA: Imm1 family immunity protein [Anaerolineae bacterium]|nr:Imm1 family immunity protein [Anaerolineae bacterium]